MKFKKISAAFVLAFASAGILTACQNTAAGTITEVTPATASTISDETQTVQAAPSQTAIQVTETEPITAAATSLAAPDSMNEARTEPSTEQVIANVETTMGPLLEELALRMNHSDGYDMENPTTFWDVLTPLALYWGRTEPSAEPIESSYGSRMGVVVPHSVMKELAKVAFADFDDQSELPEVPEALQAEYTEGYGFVRYDHDNDEYLLIYNDTGDVSTRLVEVMVLDGGNIQVRIERFSGDGSQPEDTYGVYVFTLSPAKDTEMGLPYPYSIKNAIYLPPDYITEAYVPVLNSWKNQLRKLRKMILC